MQPPIREQYQPLEKLGSGGMGEVYKAKDLKLNRMVALKVLRSEQNADPDNRRRFMQEAQAASALNHPNIITIHDVLTEGGTEVMVMEYVAGRTLNDIIPRGGLRVPQVINYGAQIADALAAAHGAGIIHRDLKPGNIMVTDRDLVKLLDFGLAKLTPGAFDTTDPDATNISSLTVKGSIVGTLCYMSPEQAQGKPADTRSDIFSFGAVLYEMATGMRAFTGENGISMLSSVLRDEPRRVMEITPDVPAVLSDVIHACLQKHPDNRFQSMVELRDGLLRLRKLSESGSLYGNNPPLPQTVVVPPQAQQAAAAYAPVPSPSPYAPPPSFAAAPPSFVGAPSLGPSGPSGMMPPPQQQAPFPPPAKPASSKGPILAIAGFAVLAVAAAGGWWFLRPKPEPEPAPAVAVVSEPAPATPTETMPPETPVAATPAPNTPAPSTPAQNQKQVAQKQPPPTQPAQNQPAQKQTAQAVPPPAPVGKPNPTSVTPPEPPPPAVTTPEPAAPVAAMVPIPDGTPVPIRLTTDIPVDAAAGMVLHFTVQADVKVNNEVVIAKGANVIGTVVSAEKKKFLGMGRGNKVNVQLKTAETRDGAKLNLRSNPGAGGDAFRSLETPGLKSKTLAVAKGTETLAYTSGAQAVRVKR